MNNIVISNKEIHQVADSFFSDYINNELSYTDSEFNFFKKSAQSEVNFLVKEFEMKKSVTNTHELLSPRLVFLIVLNFTLTNTVKISSRRSMLSLMVRTMV